LAPENEARRLEGEGGTLNASNGAYRALLADFEDVVAANSVLIDSAAGNIQQTGIQAAAQTARQLVFPGLSDQQLGAIGVAWNVPDPEAVNAAVQIVESDAFRQSLTRYKTGVPKLIENKMILGIVQGQSPRVTAEQIIQAVQTIPLGHANSLMRSTQLTAYRQSGAIHRQANADILEPEGIRIAVLDGRTCLGCWSLHGSKVPLNSVIDEHRSGRCDVIGQVRGRPRNIATGQDVFDGMIEREGNGTASALDSSILDRMRNYHGASMRAMEAGAARFSDFVGRGSDPVFGPTVYQLGLNRAIGTARASEFYARNQ